MTSTQQRIATSIVVCLAAVTAGVAVYPHAETSKPARMARAMAHAPELPEQLAKQPIRPLLHERWQLEMFAPEGATLALLDDRGGWERAQLRVRDGIPVRLTMFHRPGEQLSDDQLARKAVAETHIAEESWSAEGKGRFNGWERVAEDRAQHDGSIVLRRYGTGPHGSYVLIFELDVSTPALAEKVSSELAWINLVWLVRPKATEHVVTVAEPH